MADLVELVARDIRLSLARRTRRWIDIDDLKQAGWIMLIKISTPENIARPTYPAYARQRVRGAMLDELRRLGVREQALPSREQSYDAYGTASWEGVNLKSLGERERAVICQRYHEGKSQKEVARNLRLQVKQIRELEASALQTLRTVLTNS